MKVVALVSGGKDSCYNMLQCVMAGHEIVALANLKPENKDELDSYMYQSVGHQGVEHYSDALDIPLFQQPTAGVAIQSEKLYTPTPEDEVEDLYQLLLKIKSQINIDAVSVGAVLSDYQRLRVENVCSRLGLVALAYLWRRDQAELLQEMIDYKIDAMIIKVAALGLNPDKHLGLKIREIQPHLAEMNKKYGLNICGEGGEYETFTLDCPLFRKTIVIDDYETVIHSNDNIAPVGYLNFRKLQLVDKDSFYSNLPLIKRLESFPIKTADDYISDIDKSEELDGNCDSEDIKPDENPIVEFVESSMEMMEPATGKSSAVLNHNGWCWVGGIVGESTDVHSATIDAMNKLKDKLESVGLKLQDLVRVCIYVSDLKHFSTINDAYSSIIGSVNPPVRVCLGTCLHSTTPVLINAVASSSNDIISSRHVMHVQSLSHWAPANIGPYSQAIRIGDIIYIAGQIGLVPGSMLIVNGGIRRQCKLALRHIGRLIKAMDKETQLRDVVQGVCYVTSPSYICDVRKEWEKRTNNAIMDYVVVGELPRGALVEWQVWAHRGNTRFQYEETGCVIGSNRVSLRRRWNYDNTVSAVVSCVSVVPSLTRQDSVESEKGGIVQPEMSEKEIFETIRYTLHRLTLNSNYQDVNDISIVDESSKETLPPKPVCSLQIYYRIGITLSPKIMQLSAASLENEFNLTTTLVPVLRLNHPNMFLSLCAVSH